MAAASASPRRGEETALPTRCLGAVSRLKTLSDPDRRLVRLRPRSTTIAALDQPAAPRPVPTRRRTNFQRQSWRVVAQVVKFRLDPDGTVELALFDGGAYVRAGMPPPECPSDASRARRTGSAVRARFTPSCRPPPADWPSLGAVGYVSGVGFWNGHRLPAESAANGAELQPVTSLRLIAGCR